MAKTQWGGCRDWGKWQGARYFSDMGRSWCTHVQPGLHHPHAVCCAQYQQAFSVRPQGFHQVNWVADSSISDLEENNVNGCPEEPLIVQELANLGTQLLPDNVDLMMEDRAELSSRNQPGV
jgi:hypothetical protein